MNIIKNKLLVIILVLFTLLVNLLLTSLPLLNLLHYESSAINGILFSILSGIFILSQDSRKFCRAHLLFYLSIILIPLIILTISTLLCQNCPLDDGIWFYLVISIPSILVGLAIARFSNFISKKFRYILFFLIWLIILFGFLPELYFNPQIYFYNPIFGYYPGVIYDHTIQITSQLLVYRVINTLVSLVIIYIFSKQYNFKLITKLIVITALISTYIRFDFVKSYLSMVTEISDIKAELNQEILTKNFNIFVPDSTTEMQTNVIKYDHEYYFINMSQKLNNAPNDKITSFLFGSGAQKKRLFGSGNADVAKPWLNQVYLNITNYDRSLKHEIAHIFSANFGKTLFKIPPNLNPGLIEGFAMALENNFDNQDIEYLSALAYKNNYRVSLKSLFTDFSFFASASSLSYLYAGAFLKFLADKYGWMRIKQIYSGVTFETVFEKDISELEVKFYEKLSQTEIYDNAHAANYYFGYKPLIKKICARATAKELQNAGDLYQKKNYISASEKYMEIYNYSGSPSALVGYARSVRKLNDPSEAISILENELGKFEGTSSYYFLEFALADLYAINYDSVNAAKHYSLIIDQNPHRVYKRNASINNFLLSKGNDTLNVYLKNPSSRYAILKKIVHENPMNEFIIQMSYLNTNKSEFTDEVSELMKRNDGKNLFSSELYYELSEFFYKSNDFERAFQFATLALAKCDFRTKAIIEEHIDKLEWILEN